MKNPKIQTYFTALTWPVMSSVSDHHHLGKTFALNVGNRVILFGVKISFIKVSRNDESKKK
jgi:hypothetical protein